MGSNLATVLLNVLALVQAGFEFKAIVDQVQALQSQGATDAEITSYIKGLRDAALKDLSSVL